VLLDPGSVHLRHWVRLMRQEMEVMSERVDQEVALTSLEAALDKNAPGCVQLAGRDTSLPT
jgi:hypothetical protein